MPKHNSKFTIVGTNCQEPGCIGCLLKDRLQAMAEQQNAADADEATDLNAAMGVLSAGATLEILFSAVPACIGLMALIVSENFMTEATLFGKLLESLPDVPVAHSWKLAMRELLASCRIIRCLISANQQQH